MEIYRQGDVLLLGVDEEPRGAEVPRENGRVVLAHGEATGHAHVLTDKGAMLYDIPESQDRHLRLVHSAYLRHDEHAPIELPPGTYRVRRQREYHPEEIRRVQD